MSDITRLHPDVPRWLSQFEAMSDADLEAAIADNLGVTARGLAYTATMLYVLERRGKDVSHVKRIGVMRWVVAIAAGRLLPELVARYLMVGKTRLLPLVERLPLDLQDRLARGGGLPMLVFGDDGKRTERMMRPEEMDGEEVQQVFGP